MELELAPYQVESLANAQKQEDKAYERRQLADEAILKLLSDIYTQKSAPTEPEIFFQLRQAFQEYEEAESRCCATTDRLTELQISYRD
jgi:hypothetical protein